MLENTAHTERLSKCINKSLAQLNDRDKIYYYSIEEKNLYHWKLCPLCNSSAITIISEVYLNKSFKFFATAICEECLHIFRQTSPNSAWFIECWKQISTGNLTVYNPALEEKRRIRYELYYGILHKYKSQGLLLDVGAAYGSGTKIFNERGFHAEALEPEKDRADYIQKICGIPVHHSNTENFNPSGKKYDVILFSHCLEHLDHPVYELERLMSWLKEDGILYIEIPIAWKVIDWQDSLFMAHKQNFVEKNFLNITKIAGYKIIDRYLIPDNDAPFCNLAYVLAKAENPHYPEQKNINISLIDPPNYSAEDLINLYRIQLPLEIPDKVLKFNVPYINHFYHILRKDRYQCHFDNGFISYVLSQEDSC